MIGEAIKKRLMGNWGDMATSMNCYVEVKFISPTSPWACYVYAINPEDEDGICCIIDGQYLQLCEWTLKELYSIYTREGEHLVVDEEFRRIRTSELFKRLNEQGRDYRD